MVFLASGPRRCSPDATVKSEHEFQEVVENRGTWEGESEIRRQGLRNEGSSTLDDCQHADRVTFRMQDDFKKSKNDWTRTRHSRSLNALKRFSLGWGYTVKPGSRRGGI
jgi:hypothetical protein